VTVDYDTRQNAGVLRWSPNPLGRKPVVYRVYASDERGFSVSDEPFEVAAGVYDVHQGQSTEPPTEFPANYLAETRETELAVVGPEVDLANANKTFYRVVAVDEAGNRSGPSDFATAPRPVIYSRPAVEAQAGKEYGYHVRASASLGDMRTRVVDGREMMNYWDAERPRYWIEQGPPWLRIDERTGHLSGTPDRAGTCEVILAVALERQQRRLDPAKLQWGIEAIVEDGLVTVGTARQSFAIDVAP
jgi:hypothetical protein